MKAIPVLLLISLAKGQELTWGAKSAATEKVYDNIGPPPNPIPVFLSPFLGDGLSEPATGLKTPVDLLELSMILPRTEEEKRKILKSQPLSRIQYIATPTRSPDYDNPRDKILAETGNGTKEIQERMWFNYEALQEMNLNRQNFGEPRYGYQTFRSDLEEREREAKQRLDNRRLMITKHNRNSKFNLTTCDDFKKKAKFHPDYVLNITWLPFYTWRSDKETAVIHKFTKVPRQMVVKIKQDLDSRLTHAVDWNQPKLLMENNYKILLISVDNSGLFYGIKDQEIPDYFKRNLHLKYPVMIIRLKLVDKYLAMMDCERYYATIMAAIDDVPKTDTEKVTAAKILKFNGPGMPVSRNLEQERLDAEAKKVFEQRKKESEYIIFKGKDNVVERDQHLDLWS